MKAKSSAPKKSNFVRQTAKNFEYYLRKYEKTITLLSFLVSIAAFSIAWNQSNNMNEQNRSLSTLNEQMTTKRIDNFPYALKEINDLIFSKPRDNENRYYYICSDVLSYGILSNNKEWHKYRNNIEAIINQGHNVVVVVYDSTMTEWQINSQFKGIDDNDLKEQKEKWLSFFSQNSYCAYFDKKAIDTINGVQNLKEYITIAENQERVGLKEDNLKRSDNANLIETPVFMPFFMWLVFDDKNEPINGIISTPQYTPGNHNVEHGFYTEDSRILNMFKSVFEIYKQQHKFEPPLP